MTNVLGLSDKEWADTVRDAATFAAQVPSSAVLTLIGRPDTPARPSRQRPDARAGQD